jgi:hypothetical protein
VRLAVIGRAGMTELRKSELPHPAKFLTEICCSVRIGAMKIVPTSGVAFFLASAMVTGFLVSSQAATTEKQAVMAAVMALFDGMSKRDAELIKKPLLTGGSMVLMREGKPVQMTFQEFSERVAKPGTTHIEERIHDPLVRIDHDLAVVWAPFEFVEDGKVDHCGTDLFSLIRTNGKWLIASIADTGRKNCSAR